MPKSNDEVQDFDFEGGEGNTFQIKISTGPYDGVVLAIKHELKEVPDSGLELILEHSFVTIPDNLSFKGLLADLEFSRVVTGILSQIGYLLSKTIEESKNGV